MIKFVCAHLKIAPHKIAPAQALDYYTHKHGRRMCAETAFKNPQRKTNDNKRHTDSRPPGAIYYLSSLFRELCARQPSPPNRQNTKPYTMLYYLCACTHTHARTRTLAHTHTHRMRTRHVVFLLHFVGPLTISHHSRARAWPLKIAAIRTRHAHLDSECAMHARAHILVYLRTHQRHQRVFVCAGLCAYLCVCVRVCAR